MVSSKEIRNQYIEFFRTKAHSFIHSSSVVPTDDPTLLFINAGMNQFKSIFLGQKTPKKKRVVNSQKCIRVSGKHNDLEEVGVDDYHHTFFEMLGNWSFGDYYKKEAIAWAWELLTDVWKLDKNRLWITIFQDDLETANLWKSETDVSGDRILKFDHKDNFWEMGEVGPCGPCSEIHYYTGDLEKQTADGVNYDPEYREIWNLVFIQYNRESDGKLTDLPEKHVDTGAGFERLVAIINGKSSNYDTDIFLPLIDKISRKTGASYNAENGIALRVIADHVRMLAFSIADGALPGNEGRGYVLRRVLRRAARFGRTLDMHEPFIHAIVPTLCKVMGETFPELTEKMQHIEKVIRSEEISFGNTLDRGLDIFDKISKKIKKGGNIAGEDAFKLYDTYGFPLDLTQLLAREKGFSVDTVAFNEYMQEQKERARKSGKFKLFRNELQWKEMTIGQSSQYIGYEQLESCSIIRKYRMEKDQVEIILNKTPFYAEQGGQTADKGVISGNGLKIEINDVQRDGDIIIHYGRIVSGKLSEIIEVKAKVDDSRRQEIKLNHTATHILHSALKQVLGEHVHQAGSMVAPYRLRFDLTHFEKISNDHIKQVENIVNDIIRWNIMVETEIKPYETARKEGAVALFGEKYEDEVRVISIPGFSKELCGGTHVERTGDIGVFKIISESSLALGVRRIEAITGYTVLKMFQKQNEIVDQLNDLIKCQSDHLVPRINDLIDEKKTLEKEVRSLKKTDIHDTVKKFVKDSLIYNEVKMVITRLDDIDDLNGLGDEFRHVMNKKGIVIIGTIIENKPMILCAITDDLTNSISAVDIVRELGKRMGGGGGGKPHLATAGGKDISLLDDILVESKEYVKSRL